MNSKKLLHWMIILIVTTILLAGCGGQSPFQPAATATPKFALKCNITTQEFGFDITGETGKVTQTSNNEATHYEYDSSGQTSGITVNVNRDLAFEETQHKYHIEGIIKLNPTTNELTYDITATGDAFGNSPQICKNGVVQQSQSSAATPIPAFISTETAEIKVQNPLLGVWKTDDMRAPDNSLYFSYSVYIQFTDTNQYVYHGVDTFNSNQPTDASTIVFFNLNDSTLIKEFINIPEHPEYLGKFQKWTWRFDNGNVLFTVYGIMDSQDLALNDSTITTLATGVKVQP